MKFSKLNFTEHHRWLLLNFICCKAKAILRTFKVFQSSRLNQILMYNRSAGLKQATAVYHNRAIRYPDHMTSWASYDHLMHVQFRSCLHWIDENSLFHKTLKKVQIIFLLNCIRNLNRN